MVVFPFLGVLKKQHVSNGCKMYVLRSPVQTLRVVVLHPGLGNDHFKMVQNNGGGGLFSGVILGCNTATHKPLDKLADATKHVHSAAPKEASKMG